MITETEETFFSKRLFCLYKLNYTATWQIDDGNDKSEYIV